MKQTIVFLFIISCGLTSFADSAAQSCMSYSQFHRQQCYETASRLGLLGLEVSDCKNIFDGGDRGIQCLQRLEEGVTLSKMGWCKNNMDTLNEFKCVDIIGHREVSSEVSQFCVNSFDGDRNELDCIQTLTDFPQITLQVARNCERNTQVDSASLQCMKNYLYSVTVDADTAAPIEAVAQ